LYLADFDLLTRVPEVGNIDIVATEQLLASGFHQRIHQWLPGIEEIDAVDLNIARAPAQPMLAVPEKRSYPLSASEHVFVHRDREEELIAIARRIKARTVSESFDRVAVVFKRPLPYLYLARDVFGSAGIPYRTGDSLPLAAEPFTAAVDLALECVESDFSRQSLVALLRSPHLVFHQDGTPITRDEIGALDRALSESRYLGGLDRLAEVSDSSALRAARHAAGELAPLVTPMAAAQQLRTLMAFIEGHGRPIEGNGPLAARLRRAKTAVMDTLESLAAAHAAHDDPPTTIVDVAIAIRRWIEEQMFVPESDEHGVQLLGDQAARYGSFDDMAIVGLIEGEWPERPRRNIFCPPSVLRSLGWPPEKDRRAAADAHFIDLLRSPSRCVTVSTVTLDDEALVELSTVADEIPRARLSSVPFVAAATVSPDQSVGAWADMRRTRSPFDAGTFHGQTGALAARAWSVSALETYLGCPFKFFAQHVLRLEEEPEDEEIMDPRAEGQFVHEVFETFFKRWQADGHGAVTPENLDAARRLFADVVEQHVTDLSETEAALQRTRLLGSPAAAGLGEAVLRMEAERPVPVVGRFLEHRLEGNFVVQTSVGSRSIALKGKADRVDLLADGTFRLIDYKLGWPPNKARALQLPIYGLCAEQRLAGHLGKPWTLSEAVYLAFKGPKRVVPLFSSRDDRDAVLADAQTRLVDAVDAISRGEFPPRPDDVFRCETCSYGAVCRKDYVGDV
jgi:RecB family exonuclease